MSTGFERWLDSRWMEPLLLRRAARTVASYPVDRAATMRAFFEAGELRRHAADDLARTMPVASLPLYREAALFYMAALSAVRADPRIEDPLLAEPVVQDFLAHGEQEPPPFPDAELDEFFRFLTSPDPSWLDRQSRRKIAKKLHAIRSMVTWLRGLTEPRSRAHIRALRAARVVALLALLVGVVTWKAGASMRAKNIALNKPVTASSFYPLADFAPGGLTDGETAGTYGVHTNREGAPWVQVDLGEVFRIDRIEIYNRNDGWFDDGLPMALVVSENGQEFIVVDTRRESFGSSSPWTYLAHDRRVRYIRVKGAPGSYVALGEIEAFGKK